MLRKDHSRLVSLVHRSLAQAHAVMAFSMMDPSIPLVLVGLSYVLYASAAWPCISYVVQKHQLGNDNRSLQYLKTPCSLFVGPAYGLAASIQNLGLAIVPVIVGTVKDWTD